MPYVAKRNSTMPLPYSALLYRTDAVLFVATYRTLRGVTIPRLCITIPYHTILLPYSAAPYLHPAQRNNTMPLLCTTIPMPYGTLLCTTIPMPCGTLLYPSTTRLYITNAFLHTTRLYFTNAPLHTTGRYSTFAMQRDPAPPPNCTPPKLCLTSPYLHFALLHNAPAILR